MDEEKFPLSEQQIEALAKKLEERFYANVGKTFVSKLIWALGIIGLGVAAYFSGK